VNCIRILSAHMHRVHLFISCDSRDLCHFHVSFRKPLSRIIVFSLTLMCIEIEELLITAVQPLKYDLQKLLHF
jgi:hypothetical protein